MTDLSVILTAHREGILAGPTIRSAQAAMVHARAAGAALELIVVLDRADDDTRAIMRHGFGRMDGASVTFLDTDEGDPGRARNRGIERAAGFAATFLDADDLVSENWFTQALTAARARPDAIFHPAVNQVFGIESNLWWHVDSESALFDPLYLEWSNYWTAISCAPVDTYRRLPFAANNLHQGFGHEDWHWNRVTLAAGHPHKPVPDTVYFIRRRRGSQMSHVQAADGVSWPMREALAR
ncbi:MAG: glycosyltransferase [Paracoccus sp. (in: a-proteobacteria)]|uniref:glycosyltransferase family 2 protein n=1 Tax=Paracoccus sp. TaxID=267 RepID=UPI0026DFE362|nr:glycosyltransferase [Paracoccus sp. (in: a-proteobacteria)]MDO5622707.1 glycosyltransferase [Paracoccus sp. (in: a-proteobacteria)]